MRIYAKRFIQPDLVPFGTLVQKFLTPPRAFEMQFFLNHQFSAVTAPRVLQRIGNIGTGNQMVKSFFLNKGFPILVHPDYVVALQYTLVN